MKKLYFGSLVTILSVAAIACSHTEKRTTMNDADVHTDAPAVTHDRVVAAYKVAKIDFAKGSNVLSQSDKNELMNLINHARSNGKIDEVKVLAWADHDYSMDTDANKAPSRAIDLADARAKAIRSYIREALNFSDIDTHNMAARPGALSKLFKTDDYKIKEGTYDADGTAFHPAPAPQKALVVVEMEGHRT